MKVSVEADPRPDLVVEVTRAMFAQPDQWYSLRIAAGPVRFRFRARYRYLVDNGRTRAFFHSPSEDIETTRGVEGARGVAFVWQLLQQRFFSLRVHNELNSFLKKSFDKLFGDTFGQCFIGATRTRRAATLDCGSAKQTVTAKWDARAKRTYWRNSDDKALVQQMHAFLQQLVHCNGTNLT